MKALPLALVLPVALAAGCSRDRDQPEQHGKEKVSDTLTAMVSDTFSFPAAGLPEELPAGASLSDYLQYAEARNPGVQAAYQRWQAEEARAPQMRSLPDPQLRYEFTDMGGSREQMVALAQTVPWPGKLVLRGRVAEGEAEAARQRYQAARLALAYRVKRAHYEHWYLARAVAVTRESLELARAVEETARARYKAAAAEYSDLLKAQVEVARTEDLLRELQAMRGPVVARLNAELGRPAGAPLAEARDAPPPERLAASDAEVLAWVEARSPDLAAMDAEVRAARDSTALALRGPIPDLMLSAGPAFMEPEGMDREEGFKVGVGITVPLWFGKYRAANREARARLEAARLSREETSNRLGADAKMVLFAVRDAERKAQLYREAIVPRSEQAAETAKTAYAAGKVPFVELADSQRMLLQFRLDLVRALANREKALAELEMMVGRGLPTEPEGPAKPPAAAGDEGSKKEVRP
jgi:outer membrane protein TolC